MNREEKVAEQNNICEHNCVNCPIENICNHTCFNCRFEKLKIEKLVNESSKSDGQDTDTTKQRKQITQLKNSLKTHITIKLYTEI